MCDSRRLARPQVAWRSEGAPSPFELGLHGGRQLLEGISVLQSIGFRGLQQAFQIPESRIGSVSQSSVFGKSLPDAVPIRRVVGRLHPVYPQKFPHMAAAGTSFITRPGVQPIMTAEPPTRQQRVDLFPIRATRPLERRLADIAVLVTSPVLEQQLLLA